MALLLLVSSGTYRPNTNNIGDIVSIKDDDHIYGPAESGGFTIKYISGSIDYIDDKLISTLPDDIQSGLITKDAEYYSGIIEKYSFVKHQYTMLDITKDIDETNFKTYINSNMELTNVNEQGGK